MWCRVLHFPGVAMHCKMCHAVPPGLLASKFAPPCRGVCVATLQGQKPIKQDIQQPANLPVGFLRRLLAEWLGKAPQYVRLVAGVSAHLEPLTRC